MVVGNKCDMDDQRQVSQDRGAAVSKSCLTVFQSLSNYTNFSLVTYRVHFNVLSKAALLPSLSRTLLSCRFSVVVTRWT